MESLSPVEKDQFITLSRLLKLAEKLTSDQLYALVGKKIDLTQPTMTYMIRKFYRQEKLREHIEDLMRFMVVLWLYYTPLLPEGRKQIEASVYKEMKAINESWHFSLIGQPKEMVRTAWATRLRKHSSGLLIRMLHDRLVTDPGQGMRKLSPGDRLELMRGFMVLLDCLEQLRLGK